MADSSNMNSSDVLKEIMEQTSNLEEGEVQEETTEETFEPQEEQVTEEVEEETQETSEQVAEETQEASEATEKAESSFRIKYKGKEVDIPDEKIREYVQKGYRYEEKVKELKDQLTKSTPQEPIDFSKIDEEFVSELQKSPVKTLMQFTKTILESTDRERQQQRKVDRAIEKEFAENIPMWDAIKDTYQDYRDEGYDPNTAVKLAHGDFFTSRYFESKQKGVDEGVKKTILKQKTAIPSGSKKGVASTNASGKDLEKMTSAEMARALGFKYTKHPDW